MTRAHIADAITHAIATRGMSRHHVAIAADVEIEDVLLAECACPLMERDVLARICDVVGVMRSGDLLVTCAKSLPYPDSRQSP